MTRPSAPAIHGTCHPRYARVRDAFAEGFRARDEIGASVAVVADGETVVELWAGHADPARSRPWERDTIVHMYSATKGMTALCALRLVARGALDLDAPVARYWPEFAQAGKGDISVRWLISHRAGLPALRRRMPPGSLYDWDAMCAALAEAEPCVTPGQVAYHPVTFGWLVGELVRRVDGRSLGRFFREEIGEPLGADLHIGLGPAEEKRAADITLVTPPPEIAAAFAGGEGGELPLVALAFMNPQGTGDHNCAAHRRAEIPAINAHGTALALAKVYGALARGGELDGVRVLAPSVVEAARTEQVRGIDPLMAAPIRMGLGYWITQPGVPGYAYGPGERSFGHPGAGGSLGFADPDARLGFGYVTNRMGRSIEVDERPQALIDALYAC
ncbi:MAG TPA: serine hydrolase domain-containing protein [Myxococcota bacterium]|nr:serine hydrolase domain-containing protein [Myxococcota bacterium]